MRSMTNSVDMVRIIDSVIGETSAAAKFPVVNINARVYYIAKGVFAASVVVDVGCAWFAAVRDTA